MRPSQDVLTEFYSLAELNAERRIKAVESIVNHEDVLTHRKYILERSVEGLTSSRDGVRLGYVTLFTELLKKCSKDYEFFMLEQIMKEKIESQGHDVGQYSVDIAKVLFMSAILKSGKYSSEENIKIIVDKLMAILKGSPLLKIFIYETISTQMINIKPDQFNQHYWKFFKSDKMSGELLWFISKLPLAHKKAIHKACKFLGPKGEWTFEAHHYESLITLLKESQPAWKSGVIEILSRIPKMYENVIEKYASSNESDQLKTLERYSLCIPAGIVNGKIPMNVIVSEKFIECIYKLSAFSGVTRKLVSVAIYQLLKQIHENVIARNSPAIEIVSIIKRCDEICKGSFDAITCPKHFVFTVEMMKSMKVEDIAGYYLGNVSVLKRVIASIKDEESSDKLGALFKLVLENRDTVNGTHVTNGISEMLSLVFLVRSERNQITKVELKESQKNVIADAYKYVSDEEFEGKSVVSTTVFKALKIIEAVTEDAEDLKAVEGIIEEIRSTTDQELTSGIFFDMLFTILGRQSKIFKLIGFYMFTAASVGFGIDEFQFMIETVTKSNEALLKGDDEENEEEDDEFKPITKEEREALKKMQAEVGGEEAEESEGEEGDSEDDEEDVDMDESEDEDEEIDEGYKNAIMEALGDAAQVNSDDEDIVFDDEAMFKIDGALAQAFKKHFGANKKQLNKELRSYGATFK
uniref:Myb-binding protein 1A n=1 Tax=Rhabditophanes sp. KR3021 TaxID=114890 RepID=A0AC35TZU6_9BILA